MIKKVKKYLINLMVIFAGMMFLAGCHTPQDVTYFQDINQESITLPTGGDLKIEPNDKLSIIVKTMDPVVSAMFNLGVVAESVGDGPQMTSATGNFTKTNAYTTGVSKYTVSPTGTIDFPFLGEVKVAGMTRNELSGFIKGELMGRQLAKDPVVIVEFANMGYAMLGDINRPGRYELTKDKFTIIDAISMAGDLSLQGKRENIAVLREEDGKVNTYRVDLTNFKELTESPVYYLKQGDVIYVEPNDMRKRQTTTNGNNIYTTGFWISVASLLTSITTTVGVFVLR